MNLLLLISLGEKLNSGKNDVSAVPPAFESHFKVTEWEVDQHAYVVGDSTEKSYNEGPAEYSRSCRGWSKPDEGHHMEQDEVECNLIDNVLLIDYGVFPLRFREDYRQHDQAS